MKTELVQILLRHGARTCIEEEITLIPSYVSQNLQDKYGQGQLTDYGKVQMYKLGCALRSRYDDFLGLRYHAEEVCGRSTDIDRTKISLQLVLAGLYPPTAEQVIHPSLKWIPVPISTVPFELDFLLLMFCKPRFKKAFEELEKQLSAEIKELPAILKLKQFFKDKDVEVLKEPSLKSVYRFYSLLEIHKMEKCRLPHWYSEDIHNTMRELTITLLDMMSGTLELKRMLSGPLIRKIIENMNVKNEMKNPRKIYLYSVHDSSIGGFLRAHNVTDVMKYPGFGSAVIIEKLKDSEGQLFVRLLAWTGVDENFVTIKLGRYEDFCPIGEYLKIVEDIVPSAEELDEMIKDCVVDVKKINSTDSYVKKV